MNVWLWAATLLVPAQLVCLTVCAWARPIRGVIALETAGVAATVQLLLIAEGTHREPFADLAVVFAVLSFIGALAFARLLERRV